MLASCTANLSKFHVFFLSTLIRLDKDAFEGHLCQTVNNFVKQNKSSPLSPLRKRRPPQHIKHIRNTRVSRIPTFDEPCSSTLHPLNFVTVVFLVWIPNSGAILHKRAKQIEVTRLLKLLWAALHVATQKRKLGVVGVVYPLQCPLLVVGVRCSHLWSTSHLLRPSGQQCSHSGVVCPQIRGRQCGAYVGAVEEMMYVVCVDVTEGA